MLPGIKIVIAALERQQFGVLPAFQYLAGLDYQNLVGLANR
jgi:hypothetical protein